MGNTSKPRPHPARCCDPQSPRAVSTPLQGLSWPLDLWNRSRGHRRQTDFSWRLPGEQNTQASSSPILFSLWKQCIGCQANELTVIFSWKDNVALMFGFIKTNSRWHTSRGERAIWLNKSRACFFLSSRWKVINVTTSYVRNSSLLLEGWSWASHLISVHSNTWPTVLFQTESAGFENHLVRGERVQGILHSVDFSISNTHFKHILLVTKVSINKAIEQALQLTQIPWVHKPITSEIMFLSKNDLSLCCYFFV